MLFMFLKYMSISCQSDIIYYLIHKLICFDDIVIDLLYSWNFTSITDIKRKYNSNVNLSKFTFNKNILSRALVLVYDQDMLQILFKI